MCAYLMCVLAWLFASTTISVSDEVSQNSESNYFILGAAAGNHGLHEDGAEEPEHPRAISLPVLYEQFIDSLDQTDEIKERYRDFLIGRLSEREIETPIDNRRKGRILDFLENERHRFDLSWYRTRFEVYDDMPLEHHLEFGKRELWILAPHLCLTLRNAILCDSLSRSDLEEGLQSDLNRAMRSQGAFTAQIFQSAAASALADHPIRERILTKVLDAQLQHISSSIAVTVANPLLAPSRRILSEEQLNEIRHQLQIAASDILSDAEDRAYRRIARSDPAELLQQQIAKGLEEGAVDQLLDAMDLLPEEPSHDDWLELVHSRDATEQLHIKFHYDVARLLLNRLAHTALRYMLTAGFRFDPNGTTEYCLPNEPIPVEFEIVYSGLYVQVLLVDGRFGTLRDFVYDPELDPAALPLTQSYRPNTTK